MQHTQLDLNALNYVYWKRRMQQCKAEFKKNQPQPIQPNVHSPSSRAPKPHKSDSFRSEAKPSPRSVTYEVR